MAHARCSLAEAEIALVLRDLGRSTERLRAAGATLGAFGDFANAAHAGYLESRSLLLIGRLDEAEQVLGSVDVRRLPVTSRVGYDLVAAGIATRRIRATTVRDALDRAKTAAAGVGNAALKMEVVQAFEAPAARLFARDGGQILRLDEIECLFASDALIIDACRNTVRGKTATIALASKVGHTRLTKMVT